MQSIAMAHEIFLPSMMPRPHQHHLNSARARQPLVSAFLIRKFSQSQSMCKSPLYFPPRRGLHAIAAAEQNSGASTEASVGASTESRSRDQEPEDARSAIALGLRLYEDGQYESALDLFSKAIKLPGTGIKRFRDKPREASDGERNSALYNAACCFSRLDQEMDGLKALATALEAGYDNFDQIRQDPDLEGLRAHPKFEGLLARFEKPKGGFLSGFMNGFKS